MKNNCRPNQEMSLFSVQLLVLGDFYRWLPSSFASHQSATCGWVTAIDYHLTSPSFTHLHNTIHPPSEQEPVVQVAPKMQDAKKARQMSQPSEDAAHQGEHGAVVHGIYLGILHIFAALLSAGDGMESAAFSCQEAHMRGMSFCYCYCTKKDPAGHRTCRRERERHGRDQRDY